MAAAPHNATADRVRRSSCGRQLIVGVDRLDYSKGIERRMLAYKQFLARDAATRSNVTYLQVTPQSRSEIPEYAEIRGRLAATAGRINGAYGDVDWMPVRYVNRMIRHRTLCGIYRMSRFGLVTPLRDGMNLVAKEYIAAQDPDDPGVLVLSCFAGAADELTDALLVNPYDVTEMAETLARALRMTRQGRNARWQRMFDHLRTHNAARWAATFLGALGGSAPGIVGRISRYRRWQRRRRSGRPTTKLATNLQCGIPARSPHGRRVAASYRRRVAVVVTTACIGTITHFGGNATNFLHQRCGVVGLHQARQAAKVDRKICHAVSAQ